MLGQTFTLYNVAGLIDKQRNIYYVPHQKELYNSLGDRVCDKYLKLFNTVCPSSTTYRDIRISNWSPEDRTLKVNGTIDNFRVSRGQGLALNYCIVSRTVAEGSGERTYYYAFFIDSVRQAGAGSVELMLSVDHFTNFFYLNNEENPTEDYDPFNPVMRNCFVERQHYDRFRKINVGGEDTLELINEKIILGTNESFRYRYQYKDKRYLLTLGYNISFDRYSEIYDSLKQCNNRNEFINIISRLNQEERELISNLFIQYLNIDFKENYLVPITYGYAKEGGGFENGKSYKGAYTNVSEGVSSPIIHVVFPFVSIPYDLSNIGASWISLKTEFRVENTVGTTTSYSRRATPTDILNYLEEIGANKYILTAFISKYSPLYKNTEVYYSSSNLIIGYKMNIVHTRTGNYPSNSVNIYTHISEPILDTNDFIPALLPFYENVNVDGITRKVIITGNIVTASGVDTQVNPTLEVMFLKEGNTWTENTTKIAIERSQNVQEGPLHFITPIRFTDHLDYTGFILPTTNIEEFNISISNNVDYDSMLGDGFYYEPILESDPYKFYSISYNEMEEIIHKLRYIDTYRFTLTPIISYNDAYKVGIIPAYNINGKVERYYGESIVTVISSQIPIVEDSWLSYYIQNKAQMKNQYAVNDYQRGSDLAQRIFNTAPAQIGAAFLGGGTGSGYSQIVKEVSGVVDDAIDWVQSNKVIRMQQQSKLADIGAKPDTIKLSGSDLLYDLSQGDLGFHINYYVIDSISYNSIAKYLERNGYEVSIQDNLNPFNRVGLNFIKLGSFDFVEDNVKISTEQSDAIYDIFLKGVTLLHDKDYLHNLGENGFHNIEKSLTEEETLPIVFRTISREDIDNHLEVVFNTIMESISTSQPAKLQFSGNTGGYTVRKRSRQSLEIIETIENINQITLLANDSINVYRKSGSSINVLNVSFADYLNSSYYITIQLNEGQSPSTSDLNPSELIKNLYAYINEGGDN